jgi:hypothetical protein
LKQKAFLSVSLFSSAIATGQGQENEKEQQQDTVGVASKSDVSPNTPRADEAGL